MLAMSVAVGAGVTSTRSGAVPVPTRSNCRCARRGTNQFAPHHYDDTLESDITTVRGLRCTTRLRTVIDIAPQTSEPELKRMVRDCLDRGQFTIEEALARLAQADMNRAGEPSYSDEFCPDEGRPCGLGPRCGDAGDP
jgi:hypothetical protein